MPHIKRLISHPQCFWFLVNHFVVTAFLVYEQFQGERSPESLLFRCSHIFSTLTGIGMCQNIGATSFLVTVSGKCVQYLICTLML